MAGSRFPFSYCYQTPAAVSEGGALYLDDLKATLTAFIGQAPTAFDASDDRLLTIAINPTERPSASDRWIGLYNSCIGAGSAAPADLVIQNAFRHPRELVVSDQRQRLCSVQTTPSRTTPTYLAALAAAFDATARNVLSSRSPLIALLVRFPVKSDFNDETWNKKVLFHDLKKLLASTPGDVLLVHEGEAEDRARLEKLIAKRLVPDSWWADFGGQGNTAHLAMALAETVIVTGDTIPRVSDAITARRDLYILHDWPSVKRVMKRLPAAQRALPPAMDDAVALVPSITPEPRAIEIFLRRGLPGSGDGGPLRPGSYHINTGWPSFLEAFGALAVARMAGPTP
jgi:hypothetical protein